VTAGADHPIALGVGDRRRAQVGLVEAERSGWAAKGDEADREDGDEGADQPTALAVGVRRRAQMGAMEATLG
jgi:hypothetical protein